MTKGDEGEWYKCCRCNHAVMPGNKLFECACRKCSERQPFFNFKRRRGVNDRKTK
jgi:hypothetical protein